MNTTNPIDYFYDIDCPDELLVLTSFEIGQIYENLWG